MDIKDYILPLLKHWWLLLASAIIAATSSFLVVRQQPPEYQTRATLLIGRAVYASNPTGVDIYTIQTLANYYADISQREGVRQGTMAALQLSWLPDYTARPLPNSQMIEIVVTDNSPIRAQAVANELANQLIQQSPTGTNSQEEHQVFIDQQLTHLESNITETINEIARQQDNLAELQGAREIAEAQAELSALQEKLTTLQGNYASLLASSDRGANNSLTLLEPAALPAFPVGPNKSMIILLSSLIGVVIAAGTAYLLEYLDNTLKDPDHVSAWLNLPVLGYIAEMGRNKESGAYVAKQPRSTIAEAFRTMRVNLEFMEVDRSLKSILVCSTGGGEGKTLIAINLAVIIAQGGKKVILVDGDLRKPSIHRYLAIPNATGLTNLFRGRLEPQDVLQTWYDGKIQVLTAGEVPPNPTDLLGSKKMDLLLEKLCQMADVVIVDGPPVLVSDALVLATKMDGLLFIVRYGHTPKNAARSSIEQLRRVGARISGLVFNRLPRSHEGYYGHYLYSSGYYSEGQASPETGTTPQPALGKASWLRFFKRKDADARSR